MSAKPRRRVPCVWVGVCKCVRCGGAWPSSAAITRAECVAKLSIFKECASCKSRIVPRKFQEVKR